ncbi:MAG TPA: DUF4115 domain-containing protein, partial [Burkholderiales bacterium]
VGAFALDWYVRDRRAGQTVHVPTSVQNPSAAKQLDLAVKPMPVAQSVAPEAVAAEPAPVIPEPVVEAAPEMKEPVASAPVAPASEPVNAVVGKPLQMRFSDKVWVEVKDARGKVLVSRLAGAGTLLALDGTPPLSVVLGNAAAVELSYGGERIDLAAHAPSGVARLTLE